MARRAPSIPCVRRGDHWVIKGTNVRADSKRGIAMAKKYASGLHAETKRQQGRAPGYRWRVQDCGEWSRTKTARKYPERFDEIVVDGWLHVERMDTRSFYGTIAGLSLWWLVKQNGDVEITHVETRDVKFGAGSLRYVANELRKLLEGRAGT